MPRENTITRKRRGRAKLRKCNSTKSERVTKTKPTNLNQRIKRFAHSDQGSQMTMQEIPTVQKRLFGQNRQGSDNIDQLVRAMGPPKYCGPPQVRCEKRWGQSQACIMKNVNSSSPRLPPGIVTSSLATSRGESCTNDGASYTAKNGGADLWYQPTLPSTNACVSSAHPIVGMFPPPMTATQNDSPAARLKKLCIAANSGLSVMNADELVMRYHTPSPPPLSSVTVPKDADKCDLALFSEIDSGMFFICNEETEKEVFDLKLFALPAEYLAVMQQITDTTALCLYRKSNHNPVIYGVFLRDGPAGLNIVESAFGRRYPAQIRFKELFRFPALPEHLLCKEERYQYYPGQRKKLFRVQPQYGSLLSKPEIQTIITDFYQNRLNLAVE